MTISTKITCANWSAPFLLVLALSFPVAARSQEYGLANLIQIAVNNHPLVKSAMASESAAHKNMESVEWQAYPTPSITVEGAKASATDLNYRGDDKVTTLRLSQPLFSGGAYTAQLERAKANLRVSQASTRELSLQIAQKVVTYYTDWLTAELKAQSWQKSAAIHQKLLQSAKNRITQGVSAPSDLILVQGRLDATNAELFSAALQAELALNRLREQLDMPLTPGSLKTNVSSPLGSNASLESLLIDAEGFSPSIEKAKAQVVVAQAIANERQSSLLPDVNLRLERQIGNFAIANTAPENRILLSLTTKFGAGLSSLSNISAARAQEESSQLEIQVQRRILREQVLNDYSTSKSFKERLQVLNRALEASQAVLDSFERQFSSGRKSWLDLMTTAREVAQNETQIADLKGAEMQTSWRLHILTTGSYFPRSTRP